MPRSFRAVTPPAYAVSTAFASFFRDFLPAKTIFTHGGSRRLRSFGGRFMQIVLSLGCVLFVLLVLMDGFETLVLPRRVSRPYRFARFFYLGTWQVWRFLALRLPRGKRRDNFLSYFGPLSVLFLFISWVAALIFGFAA